MTMLKIQSTKNNEKGIALLFSLIMLSLLMILALGFALDSMFEQKAAYNSASSSASGFMGQAQLNQILLLMKEGEANFDDNGMIYSHDASAPVTTDTDMLKDKLPVEGVLIESDGCFNPAVIVNWNYVKDTDGKIIGRTAFVVVPEDKIPLDSLVDDRVGTTAYPKHDEKDDTETRVGKYVSEINVRGAIPAVTTSISTITEKLNWAIPSPATGAGFTNGKYTGSWTSFNSLFSAVGVTADADKTEFESKLTLTTVEDEEAFWVDLDADKKIGSSEIYNRFDLTREDWSTSSTNVDDKKFIKNVILLDSDSDGVPDINMDAWNGDDSLDDFSAPDTLSNYSKGLPWLATFGYDTGGVVSDTSLGETFGTTVAGVTARRFQIAANLKDYCDDDGTVIRPTSDANPATWVSASTVPTYTGNEKTPYLNKVGIYASAVVQADEIITGNYDVSAVVEMRGYVELINLYGASWPDDLGVAVKATISLIGDVNGTSVTIPDQIKTFNITVASTIWNNGYSNFAYPSTLFSYTTPITNVSTLTPVMTVKVHSVTIDKIVLYEKTVGGGYDYTQTLTSSPPPVDICSGGTGTTGEAWFGWAAHDPRQNLNSGDWLELTHAETPDPSTIFSFVAGGPPYKGAANFLGPNPTDDPSTGNGLTADKEANTDPANGGLSTAYIRNAPMESPWELGFIHRGAKWETLNLKKYDKTKAFQIATTQINSKDYIPGGGAYTDGDANILDQIKMTEKAESPQKMNLSSPEDATFDALFYKVKLGCTINDTMTVKSIAGLEATLTGTVIDLTASSYNDGTTGMRKLLKDNFASADITTFTNLTRASAVDILKTFNGGTTDAAQEELIGKIINLTKVGVQSGDFAIIVLSQTINDIGGPGVTSINVYKVPADGSAAKEVTCTIGSFDVEGTDPDWTKNAYGDEITGEQKIMVKGNNSANGIITIKSFQYID